MKVTEIYKKYQINKGLAEHMLRVAAVAKQIGEKAKDRFDTDLVVRAALVHDLGNIVKSRFEFASEFFEPEGVEFYKTVKVKVLEKYGNNDHEVTLAMMREIRVPEPVISIAEATGIVEVPSIHDTGTYNEKLMMYADMRVGPYGVISLDARCDDVLDRYVPRSHTAEEINFYRGILKKIEKDIFAELEIKPNDVTDTSTKSIQSKLLDYMVV